nr:DNA helicase [Tanacetum cinerariifolium]
MGSVRETGYLDVKGSCSGNVVERESAIASVDNSLPCSVVAIVNEGHRVSNNSRNVSLVDRQTGSVDSRNSPLTTDVVCDVHVGDGPVRIVNDRQTGSVDSRNLSLIADVERFGQPQLVNKLHSSYMALQFPLLFIHGEHGYSKEMKMVSVPGASSSEDRRLTMKAYYSIDWVREHQNDIRNDYLSGIYDAINRGNSDGSDCGGKLILPQSFTGGPRYMYSHYLDALAICRVHGNPSYYITFTCNVKWPEIVEYMEDFPGLTTADRADVVDRIFAMKIRQFVKYLRNIKPFGKIIASLPHCHTLIWVDENSRIQNHEDIDAFISAEHPLPEVDPVCYKIVSEFMIHGPCGEICPTAACMKNGPKCAKYFLKEYCDYTYMDHDGFVHYRRRDTGATTVKQNVQLDNGYVVPYNKQLLKTFYAHINVEYCGWTIEPAVQVLVVHGQNMQRIVFRERDQLQSVADNPNKKKTTLTEWLQYDEHNTDGRSLTYLDFPSKYVWNKTYKYWQRRRQINRYSIGRMSYIHPAAGDLFYQRMLISHQRGCRIFRDIHTVNYVVYPTCRAACEAMGLLGDDTEWESSLKEAASTATPSQLRILLAHIFTHCQVSNPLDLWKRTWNLMSNDIPYVASISLGIQELIFVRKTFLWKTIIYALRAVGKIVLAVASSGIASLLLPPENMWLTQGNLLEADKEEVSTFVDWLLNVGDGIVGVPDELDPENTSWIRILEKFQLKNDENGLTKLIQFIYDEHSLLYPTAKGLQEKAIVCPKNDTTDLINAKVMSMLLGYTTTYTSHDEAMPHGHDGGEVELLYLIETLEQTSVTAICQQDKGKNILTKGTPVQANMGLRDAEYFDQLLQLKKAYRFTGFSCEPTDSWERTLPIEITLIFGRYLQVEEIATTNFLEHYFNFAAYNELSYRLAAKKSDTNSLADKAILSGAENHPLMLQKDMYDSWRSRMELYMLNRQHGRMILESVEHGPLLWPSVTEDGVTRLKKHFELSSAEAIQADCDVKAINIILQALPPEIYALVSTHKVAKDLWERIQMLMQGTSLTKQERECKLYDAFDKF